MASEAKVLQVLEVLTVVFPNFPLNSQAVGVYVRLLEDIPDEVLGQAALDLLSRSTYFPTIAELRTAALDLLEAVDPIPSEYEAWGEVQEQIGRVGHSGEPEFCHELVKRVVDILGWRYLCLSEEAVADRAHFFQAYKSLAQTHRQKERRLAEVKVFVSARRQQLPAGSALPEEAGDVE
jgi:hypothetical protein